MDDDRDDILISRLDVVDTGHRRRWTPAEKLRIVEESFAGPRRVAATARRHHLTRSLLAKWRQAWRCGELGEVSPGFMPVTLSPPHEAGVSPTVSAPASGRVEIVLCNGRRLLVEAGVDAENLARLVQVLDRA